jgi:hypothetical protein
MVYNAVTGVLDFVHRPVFKKLENFRKLDLFPSSGEVGKTFTLLN